MQCTKPITLLKNVDRKKFPDGLEVPCGKCLQCRIAKRKEWAMRCLHEMDNWDNALFITLTYNDKSLPENSTLQKKEFQNFLKRVRIQLGKRKIKYFACGEYGEEKERPHYHAIIFGMSLNEDDKEVIRKAWPYCDWKEKSIDKGSFGIAEPDSIRYVAQYIDKKLSGDDADREYKQKNREPVFKVQSMGIGKEFALKNAKQLIDNESITMFGVPQSFPRYYLKILDLENSDFRKENSIKKQMDAIKDFTGIDDLTEIDFYKNASAAEYMKYNERKQAIAMQKENTVRAKINLKKKKI